MSKRSISAVILFTALTTGLAAQLSPAPPAADEPTITLDLKNAEIGLVLDLIAKQSGMNLVIASDVQGRVSATLHEVPWRDAFEAIVKSAGFVWVEESIGSTPFVRIEGPDSETELPIVTLPEAVDGIERASVNLDELEPELFAQIPIERPYGGLDLPRPRSNRSQSEANTERNLALALLDYLQEASISTPLPLTRP